MTEKIWLETQQYYPTIEEDKLTSIFYFTLIWNLFEKECCGKFAKINTHPESLSQKLEPYLDVTLVDSIYKHFKNRYINSNNNETNLFTTFEFGQDQNAQNIKTFVKNILLNSSSTRVEKIKALFYIAFRLRNNLYHGIKDVDKLYDQNENFKQINYLLRAAVENKGNV